jgi:hypothetical protein
LKFVYGKMQKVDTVELDKLFIDLQAVLQQHPIVPAANIDALVSEWINDILFVAGKITEEELQEAMHAFESVEASEKAAKEKVGEEVEEDDSGEDEDDKE